MATSLIEPFAAIRPAPGRAQDIAARPYDVLSDSEARAGADGRPWSFLHVSRAEIDLPADTDPHAPEVYAQAGAAFARMIETGVLLREAAPCYYVYRMTMDGHVQTGLAAAASTSAYATNRIRRHEHTRPDKELDRVEQVTAVGAHTGPVLVAHKRDETVAGILDAAARAAPVADAVTDDGVHHQVWSIGDDTTIAKLSAAFEAMPAIYIADGHHRSAAALRVAGGADDGRFLIMSFSADAMRILGYNRVVRDLNGRDAGAFLAALNANFAVKPAGAPVQPAAAGQFGMYLAGRWYALAPLRPSAEGAGAVDRLDVSVLMDRLLAPVLGIGNPRTDTRIDFVGGIRGLAELERRVDSDGWAVAFSLYPTAMADLMAVADAGDVMPPKSTWFEPKLADGLLSMSL